jgi:hypothetical protein
MSIVRVAPMPGLRRPGVSGDGPALTDDILGDEHDPPA